MGSESTMPILATTVARPARRRIPVRKICAALDREYGGPRHGNKHNPLDELVYIILSTRTRDASYRDTYRRLKHAFPTWNAITPRSLRRLEGLLRPGGLGHLKAEQIVAIVGALKERFGRATLAPLKHLSDDEAETFLTQLPGVSDKVAKCVLMYSLDRECLPVDVHVHRVAGRLGFATKRRPDTSQALIEDAIPKDLRYGFHVNAVAHGRAVCLARLPKCTVCCLVQWCVHERNQRR
ncbi:MAG: hypothetical protein JW940_32520 [Polyangiaceae bacterium]|nr:hypothetical protein [Polyangiaceae bacterium]